MPKHLRSKATLLSEKEAWLVIHKAYATPRDERSLQQKELCRFGMCMSFAHLLDRGLISEKTIVNADNKLLVPHEECVPDTSYWLPTIFGGVAKGGRYSHDLLRADFCYMQYCMIGGK